MNTTNIKLSNHLYSGKKYIVCYKPLMHKIPLDSINETDVLVFLNEINAKYNKNSTSQIINGFYAYQKIIITILSYDKEKLDKIYFNQK